MGCLPGIFTDPDHVRGWSGDRIHAALTRVFASTGFTWCADTGRVTVCGPRGDHLKVDPDLHRICDAAGISLIDNGVGFHKSHGSVDLCLEDGLSGMFLSRAILSAPKDDWVILHLDDHADMMPTLLVRGTDTGLRDPETGAPFRAASARDWHSALARGTITIGSYLTALFHDKPSGCLLHVRHLRPRLEPGAATGITPVTATSKTYPILGPTPFAALDLDHDTPDRDGTYLQSDCISGALDALPRGRLIVHIDLDFFVNDFNGTPGIPPQRLGPDARAAILRRMDHVFQGILAQNRARNRARNRPVERWIIATSPGFCAARHWSWLLGALNQRIGALHRTLNKEEPQLALG